METLANKKPTIWQVVSISSSPMLRHDRRVVDEFDNIHDATMFARADTSGDLKVRTKPERRRKKDENPGE